MNKWQAQFDRCLGPAPRPSLKPKPKSGIDKELEAWREKKLEDIASEYEREFGNPS